MLDEVGHGAADEGAVGAGVGEHDGEDVAIEHALDGDVVGSAFQAGDAADGVDERLAVVGSGLADQGAVDVEQHQRRRGSQPFSSVCGHLRL